MVFVSVETKNDTVGRCDDGELLREVAVELAVELVEKDLELQKTTRYL